MKWIIITGINAIALSITTTKKLWKTKTEIEDIRRRIIENHFQIFLFEEFLSTELYVAYWAEKAAQTLNNCMGNHNES